MIQKGIRLSPTSILQLINSVSKKPKNDDDGPVCESNADGRLYGICRDLNLVNSVLTIVENPIATPDLSLAEIILNAERLVAIKRIWRGSAEDGREFGFELASPLKHGDTFFQNSVSRYVLHQVPEAVVEISLNVNPSAAAGIGWAVGNLHLELSAEANRLLAPDEPAVRQLLDRLKVPFKQTVAIFRPGRFVRGVQPSHELGPSHKH